jgi:mercuric ion binding protein
MRTLLALALLSATLIGPRLALAETREVVLHVRNMTCSSCPYIVKERLAGIDGVAAVEVSFEEKTARVIFDDAKVEIGDLTAATAEIGYPSTAR